MSTHTNSKINALGRSLEDERALQLLFLFGKKRKWIHIAAWICAGLFFFFNSDMQDTLENVIIQFQLQENIIFKFKLFSTIIGVIISSLCVYTFLILIIPYARWKMRRRYIWTYLLFIFFAFFFLIFTLSIVYEFTKQFIIIYFITLNLAVYVQQLTFISFFYYLYLYDKQRFFQQYEESLGRRIEAEAEFLASQINPHFLFNTINNIYALTLAEAPEAKESIAKLESMIHYIHTETQQEWIALDAEIEFIKSYLSLELLRNKAHQVHFIFETDGDTHGKKIAPLLLINFIENAFKHGVKIDDQKSFVHIRIDTFKHHLTFSITNSRSKNSITKLNSKTGGIGLRNVKRRLELLYPKSHKLKINKNKHQFKVLLTLYKI